MYLRRGYMCFMANGRIAVAQHPTAHTESKPPNDFLTAVFAAEERDGEPINMEPHKHAQVRWINERSIPDEFVPATNRALTAYLNEAGPQVSLSGWS